MEYMVTGREMTQYDQNTSEQLNVPSVVLMEQAAWTFVEKLAELYDGQFPKSALVVCGTGNNGGDGIAIARLLRQRGVDAVIYAPVRETGRTSQLYDLQKEIYRAHDYPVLSDEEFFQSGRTDRNWQLNISHYDAVVDAIFGTGLSRMITGKWADIIEQMNAMSGHKVSVDIASGVLADTGEASGAVFCADDTITFSFLKCGQVFSPGAFYSGRVSVVPIGITEKSFLDMPPRARYLTREDLSKLPSRRPDSHKGSYGKLLVIAGSPQMAGAAAFAASAAYHMGTGLVKIVTPEANRIILQTKIPEAILSVYEEKPDEQQLSNDLNWADALVIGPGLGTGDAARTILRQVLSEAQIPIVMDADALNLLAEEPDLLTCHNQNVNHQNENDPNGITSVNTKANLSDMIVTPHLAEMSRLTGRKTEEVKQHLMNTAAEFAMDHQVVCVLKDAHTITALPDGRIFVNMSGNNGMATAGSGDVLSGILGGMLAQGLSVQEAAPLGVYFHGLAGDAAKERLGAHYMLASDIIDGMADVFKCCE